MYTCHACRQQSLLSHCLTCKACLTNPCSLHPSQQANANHRGFEPRCPACHKPLMGTSFCEYCSGSVKGTQNTSPPRPGYGLVPVVNNIKCAASLFCTLPAISPQTGLHFCQLCTDGKLLNIGAVYRCEECDKLCYYRHNCQTILCDSCRLEVAHV